MVEMLVTSMLNETVCPPFLFVCLFDFLFFLVDCGAHVPLIYNVPNQLSYSPEQDSQFVSLFKHGFGPIMDQVKIVKNG